jgi:hypothetical protein
VAAHAEHRMVLKMMKNVRAKFTRWYYKNGYPWLGFGSEDNMQNLPLWLKITAPFLWSPEVHAVCCMNHIASVVNGLFEAIASALGEKKNQ